MRYHDVINRLEHLQSGRIHPQLDTIRALAIEFGAPQDRFSPVHIAGTNGKGSVAAMTASILTAAGYRTGLYTSPHIFDFRERISIGGIPITGDEVSALADEIMEPAVRLGATYFETATLMAFLHFAGREVDAAVIETGLGGGWDATNIVNPALSILTHIAVDHEKYLGKSPEGIAREKAGIIKPGGTCVLAPQEPEIREVVRERAEAAGALLFDVETEMGITISDASIAGSMLDCAIGGETIAGIHVPLAGRHQAVNAATAIAAARILGEGEFEIGEGAIRRGIAACRWPGRFELIRENPTVIADVAHNPDAFAALAGACRDLLSGRRIILLFGVMQDKDHPAMLKEILPLCEAVVGAPLPGERALSPFAMVGRFLACDTPYFPCGLIDDAVRTALRLAEPDGTVLVCGSHMTVEAAVPKIR